jgi:hypothetical protein
MVRDSGSFSAAKLHAVIFTVVTHSGRSVVLLGKKQVSNSRIRIPRSSGQGLVRFGSWNLGTGISIQMISY